jgi:S-adenosylmethionine:tRNA ribosyltransferase-isomerase
MKKFLVIGPEGDAVARPGGGDERFIAGDVLVVNDSATLPASLRGRLRGEEVELRLARQLDPRGERWLAVLFGAGDWRTRTEDRPAPPATSPGEAIELAPGFLARVSGVRAESLRFLEILLETDAEAPLEAIHRHGRPIQYAHLARDYAIWERQTLFASRAWSLEPPSASFALSWERVLALRARGVELVALTHAAGISSTGDPAVDALLPLPERFEIPGVTAQAINRALADGRRVIAIGTSVARALEAAYEGGELRAGTGLATNRIGPAAPPRVASGLLTGIHEPATSHFELVAAFNPLAPHALERARGLETHEYGDACLVLRAPDRARLRECSPVRRSSLFSSRPESVPLRPPREPLLARPPTSSRPSISAAR